MLLNNTDHLAHLFPLKGCRFLSHPPNDPQEDKESSGAPDDKAINQLIPMSFLVKFPQSQGGVSIRSIKVLPNDLFFNKE